ncbi:terminase small subunit [Streptomyces phage Lizz]|nr:terminase small subunit [Streptomyces phage Lizz]
MGWMCMGRLQKRTGRRRGGRPTDITNEFRDLVTTRAIELRRESYTLRETVEIVNEEFGDSLAFETVRRWIQDRIKPELEEKADEYRQHLLDQIAIAKRALSKRVMMGDEKAVAAWTRLLDREMRLTGVEKPIKVDMNVNSREGDANEAQRLLDQFFGVAPAGEGHVIQGEVVNREQ